MSKFHKDVAERAFWTAVQAALAVVLPVAVTELEARAAVLVPVLAAVASIVKGYLAKRVGDPESASTLGA